MSVGTVKTDRAASVARVVFIELATVKTDVIISAGRVHLVEQDRAAAGVIAGVAGSCGTVVCKDAAVKVHHVGTGDIHTAAKAAGVVINFKAFQIDLFGGIHVNTAAAAQSTSDTISATSFFQVAWVFTPT